jgi:hypothetical protein
MPKKANAKKLASQQWTNIKALNEAKEGKHIIARVEKSLGFCQFLCQAETPQGIIPVTALVRGKMKGGRNAPSRVEADCYVLVEGDLTKLVEIVGVVNRQDSFEKLKKTGRVSRSLMEGATEEDDFFDRSEVAGEEGDIWVKRDDEVVAKTAHLLNRYRRRAAGQREKDEACLRAAKDEAATEDAPEEVAEEEFALWESVAPIAAQKPKATKKRTETAEEEYKRFEAELAAQFAAEDAEEAAAQKALAELQNRAVPSNWEEEIDIDAI